MDVKYIPSDWEKMRSGIKGLIGYGVYGKGMFEDLKKLNEVLEDAEADIARYDTDRAISFSHTSQKSTYQMMFEKFEVLYRFTGKVGDIVDRRIDQPFYEDMDAFVSAMEEATISKYKTTNRIGATQMITIDYQTATVMEVPKTEVSVDDLLSGGNFYGDQMKLEYEEWKKVNPDQELSQSEYQLAALNMRAFEYESIRDHQENKEFWVQIAALVVIVGVSIVCLPAGLALGAVYGTLELGSAVSGEDWVSGRELGTGERWFRGLLAPLDILPAAATVSKFTGSATNIGRITDNLATISVKTGAKEGIQQGVSQVDNLVEETIKDIPSRIKSANAAVDDQFSTNALKAVAGDDFNLVNTAAGKSPSLNIPSTRKMDNLVDDVGGVNQAAPNNSVNHVDSAVRSTDESVLKAREISPEDRVKLDSWEEWCRPSDELYLEYKHVYDNELYFDQNTGRTIYPGTKNGDPHIDGFLNGKFDEQALTKGTIIDRYGSNGTGRYFSPDGSSFESRALPPFMKNMPYERYEIIRDFNCKAGPIAPWFDQPGMGVQYFTDFKIKSLDGRWVDATVDNLIENKYILPLD